MTLPNGYRPREGDVVMIPVTVVHDFDAGDEWVHVRPSSASRYSGGFAIDMKDVRQLVSRKWEEGMPVRNASDHSERGTVVVAFDGWVVIKPLPGGDSGPWIFSNIEVEDDPTPAEPDAIEPPAPAPRLPEDDEAAAIAAGEARAAAQE